jgi:peptide/nickel transport system permease protein
VLGWAVMGIISRQVRASMLDVLNQDYILAARAKGASEPRVLVATPSAMRAHSDAHNRRLLLAYLITGAVLSEAIFRWPGMAPMPSTPPAISITRPSWG